MLRKISAAVIAAFCIALLWAQGPAGAFGQAITVTSPDHKISLTFALKSLSKPFAAGERAWYRVTFNGQTVLTDSPLGLKFEGAPPLDRNFTITGHATVSHDSTWRDRINDNLEVRDHYNQLIVHLREREAPHRRLDLIFRAYDAGAAFRYFIPRQSAFGHFVLSSEETGFYFQKPASAFALSLGKFTTPYEGEFDRMTLAEIAPSSVIGLPLLVHTAGGAWAALLEADLEDYAGMYIGGAAGVPNGLASKLSPLPGHPGEAVIGDAPKSTPWRVIEISARPGGLIESTDLLLNLNPLCALKDTSWIKPGKTMWDWWSGDYDANVSFKPGMNTATLEHYIQFASGHHIPYMLIDAGWAARSTDPQNPEGADITHWNSRVDLPQVLAFAKQRNVRVILWMHWTSVERQMNAAFPLFEKWGVAGVKIDFMNRDDQQMVNFYYRVARAAARYHLVVDFHGAFKPTGMRRTYPNQLTREGVMGMEYSKWSYRTTPYHDVILPFTRMLAGPMDYTPGCFNNATQSQFEPRNVNPMCQGTRAHQFAMYAVFFSPLQMLADYPEIYNDSPGMAYLEKVPTVWDETRAIDGDPGEYVTVARRGGSDWYLGSMTNWTPRDLDIPLSFLGPGVYQAQIFADGADAAQNAKSLAVSTRRVKAGDHLSAHLAPGGGMAVIFTPVR
ncbi:MAG: glycoside hydrolase family 97 protein [Acidobacteriota bacterium]|nr:glycoside hydrolase family 97 protein [Acidobacteriota bacterium]